MEQKKAITSSLEAKERIEKTFAVHAESHDSLDICLPIGFILGIYGVILMVIGKVNDEASIVLDININLIWGFVMAAVGLLFLVIAGRNSAAKKAKK